MALAGALRGFRRWPRPRSLLDLGAEVTSSTPAAGARSKSGSCLNNAGRAMLDDARTPGAGIPVFGYAHYVYRPRPRCAVQERAAAPRIACGRIPYGSCFADFARYGGFPIASGIHSSQQRMPHARNYFQA